MHATTTLLTLSSDATRWWVLLLTVALWTLLYVQVARFRMTARARADAYAGLGKYKRLPNAKAMRARWRAAVLVANGARITLRVFGALFVLHAIGRFAAFVAHVVAGWAR